MINIQRFLILLVLTLTAPIIFAGKITVNNGATLRGTGVIVGDIEVNSGGTVEPYTTCLSVSNASFVAGSELKVSIAGNTACTDYSQLLVNGSVDLDEATLNATTSGYTMQVLDEYVFINNDLTDGIVSPFDAISENSTYSIDGELLYASYFAGDGNDFSLLFKFIYPIGGTVSGLAPGNEVFLQNNGGEIVSINSNGVYQFPTDLDDTSAYEVLVINQPSTPNQTCTVSNGNGTVSGGAVTDINVTCVTNTYSVGGSVLGLAAGNQVVIQNNGADDLILNSNSGFVFPAVLSDESVYDVQVTVNPTAPNQTCIAINGTGALAGADVTNVIITCATNTYTIGGTVTGLAVGNSVTLQNNLTDDLVVSADGGFTFATSLDDESAYTVTVLNQPDTPNQTCTIANDSGVLSGVNQVDVAINCVTNTYTIGGTLTGLVAGNSVVLQNNLTEDLVVSTDGAFVFATSLDDESAYSVTVLTQPDTPNQTCSIVNGSGVLSGANQVDVAINCVTNTYTIGGTVTGLAAGNSVTLQNNLTDDLVVSADGGFTFATSLDDESAYTVTVLNQPDTPNQTCTITNESGVLNGADQIDVLITCTTNDYFIGGSVSGLASGNFVTLQNNATDDLMVSADGVFVFDTPLADKSAFNVSVLNDPTKPNQTCAVVDGAGTVAGDDVVNVSVSCTTNSYSVGGTLSGLLPGEMLVLQNNGGDDLVLFADGIFTFNQPIEDLEGYEVTVFSEPTSPIQNCSITSGVGNVTGQDVTDISINCDNFDLIYKNGFEESVTRFETEAAYF